MSIISKKKLNELLNLSKEPKINLVEETKKSYKIEITGDKDKVKKSSFEEIMLEFVKEQKEFNKEIKKDIIEIKSRLDVVETKLEKIENTPTMKKELSDK